ncbi:uncharacterized protein LOC142628926 [Castanea sativa]|uniref:uncharacterized protein LOC142628926 n=1 Tax=Castanea sativa TaxID=21020 RepID=UPI003F64BD6A
MTAPWPFAQWGLDIMGPFSIVVRQLKFLIVGIDYFTKWVEAEALATITEKNVRSFVWKNIICKYEIPRVLVSDNGKQFDNDSFRDFCSQLGIKNHYSSPTYPQANGQVEDDSQNPTRETPFRLAYGSEAAIPAEVGLTSYKVDNHDERRNDKAIRLQLDLVDEVRATAE